MKSNYLGSVNTTKLQKEIQAEAERLVAERTDSIIAAVQDSIMQQVLSMAFWVLHRDHVWGFTRLCKLRDAIEDEFVLMYKKPLGKEYNPLDVRAWLKEYGVDLEETQYKGGVD